MSIGNDFKEIYNAINGEGAHTTQEISMDDDFRGLSFTDGTSTPESGAISIGDMKGKTIQEPYLIEWHPTSTSGKTGSQISITGSGLNTVIKSTATNTRTNVYFTSKTQIYDNTSIKFQSEQTGRSYNNIMFGVGNSPFTDFTDPRNDILYGFYFNGSPSISTWNAMISGNTTNQPDGWYQAYPHPVLEYDTNDIFEIKIQNGFVSFWKNDVVLWNPQQSSGKVDFSTSKYLMGTMWRNHSGVKNIFIPLYSF